VEVALVRGAVAFSITGAAVLVTGAAGFSTLGLGISTWAAAFPAGCVAVCAAETTVCVAEATGPAEAWTAPLAEDTGAPAACVALAVRVVAGELGALARARPGTRRKQSSNTSKPLAPPTTGGRLLETPLRKPGLSLSPQCAIVVERGWRRDEEL
jgi:hypothetical protein